MVPDHRATVAAALLMLSTTLAASQGPAPAGCGDRAAAYAGERGFRLWITRRGAIVEDNPLRPLSSEPLVVLQVVVNGRVATAFGPDFANLRQGGPPARLESEMGGAVAWAPELDPLPQTLRVVAVDGRVIHPALTFAECGEAPKAVAPAAARRTTGARRDRGPTPPKQDDGGSGVQLPQGALPSGTLTLPPR